MPDTKDQKRVLTDHFQRKKKFIAPYNHHFNFHETDWVKDSVPELIWLAELNAKLGIRQAPEVAREFAMIVKESINSKSYLGYLSNYFEIKEQHIDDIINKLEEKHIIKALIYALQDLNNFYPNNPLTFITEGIETKSNLEDFKLRLDKLYDKHSTESIFMMANAIYIAFATDGLVVAKNTSLANFPEIINYPHTEESKRIAGSIAATINVFIDSKRSDNQWSIDFWKRGFELEECYWET